MNKEEAEIHVSNQIHAIKDLLLLDPAGSYVAIDISLITIENRYLSQIITREFGAIAICEDSSLNEMHDQIHGASKRIYGAIQEL